MSHNDNPLDLMTPIFSVSFMNWKFEFEPFSDDELVNVFQYFIKLKTLFRQGWLQRKVAKELAESSADHSFGVAILALLLTPPELDKKKVLEIALLHETGECIVGDITPSSGIPEAEKNRLEEEAVIKIFGALPEGERYISLWKEFEYKTTPEGRFVRQLDKLEMGLQAEVYSKLADNDAAALIKSAWKRVTDPDLRKLLPEEPK